MSPNFGFNDDSAINFKKQDNKRKIRLEIKW